MNEEQPDSLVLAQVITILAQIRAMKLTVDIFEKYRFKALMFRNEEFTNTESNQKLTATPIAFFHFE